MKLARLAASSSNVPPTYPANAALKAAAWSARDNSDAETISNFTGLRERLELRPRTNPCSWSDLQLDQSGFAFTHQGWAGPAVYGVEILFVSPYHDELRSVRLAPGQLLVGMTFP